MFFSGINSSHVNVSVNAALSEGLKALKRLNLSPDDVAATVDEVSRSIKDVTRVDLGESNAVSTSEWSELERELEALVVEGAPTELNKLKELSVPTSDLPNTATATTTTKTTTTATSKMMTSA